MTDDMYLNLAIELFKKGTWSKDMFIKRMVLYAKEKNIDMSVIDEIIERMTKQEEHAYTIDEKRRVLSLITIVGNERKYGDAAFEMSDEMVENFYEVEKRVLDKEEFEALHNMRETDSIISKEKEIKKVWNSKHELFIPEFSNEIENNKEKTDEAFHWNKSINDIICGNYVSKDLLGNSDIEKEEIFNYLVKNVKVEELRDVANSLISKMDPSYCLNFTIEWEKFHKEELKTLEEPIKVVSDTENIDNKEEILDIQEEVKVDDDSSSIEEVVEETQPLVQEEPKVDEVTANWMNAVVEAYDETKQEDNKEEVIEDVLDVNVDTPESTIIVPKLSFDSYGEDDLPTTEEEYVTQAENVSKIEKDSTVRKVNISPGRLAKLKRTKDKATNCSLKTIMMILAFKMAGPFIGVGAVVSYLYFAGEIKSGSFNPKNPIGKAIKHTVEKVMNIGIKKDKENERGKVR